MGFTTEDDNDRDDDDDADDYFKDNTTTILCRFLYPYYATNGKQRTNIALPQRIGGLEIFHSNEFMN